MEQYTIKTAFRMGEPDPKFGQSWYATVEELSVPVMFNLMSGSVQEMDRITFDTQEVNKFKTGKNVGKEYRRLRKVKVQEGAPRLVGEESIKQNVSSDLEERVRKLEEAVFGEDV